MRKTTRAYQLHEEDSLIVFTPSPKRNEPPIYSKEERGLGLLAMGSQDREIQTSLHVYVFTYVTI